MDSLISFLSGNVPGGIYLYFLLVIVTVAVLVFMYRVNELFSRKHLVRWLIIMLLTYSIIYVGIWLKNPPPHVLHRYTVDEFTSNSKGNWFGEYLTQLLSDNIKPYRSDRTYFFPHKWIYRTSPLDSVGKEHFRAQIYRKMPIQKVLKGEVKKNGKLFSGRFYLIDYPSGKVVRQAGGDFSLDNLSRFVQWTRTQFGEELEFIDHPVIRKYNASDSLLVTARNLFYQKDYRHSQSVLQKLLDSDPQNPRFNRWYQYGAIREIGETLFTDTLFQNPFQIKAPDWKTKLEKARLYLLNDMKSNGENALSNLLIAESYIWEKRFGAAEIFLEKDYIDNPFNIDVLLNISFFYPSRYRELGFSSKREILEQILRICPIEEDVLLKWSELVLKGNPAYTSPPKKAVAMLDYYLRMNPYSYRVWLMLGQFYSQGRNRAAALKAFMRADSLSPENSLVNYNIGVLYYEWDKIEQAKKYFEEAVRIDDFLNAHLYLGAIYKDSGDCRKALQEFRYRVAHKKGNDDYFAIQAMKGIQDCLKVMGKATE